MARPRKSDWSPRLRGFTEKYEALYGEIVTEVEQLSEDELRELVAECKRLNQSNCAWTMYHIAMDMIRGAVPRDIWVGESTHD